MLWLLTQTIVSCVAKHGRYRLPFAMAGIGVDALANKAGKMALNDGQTLLGVGAFGKVFKETRTVYIPSTKVCAVKKIKNFDTTANVLSYAYFQARQLLFCGGGLQSILMSHTLSNFTLFLVCSRLQIVEFWRLGESL